MSNVNRPAGLIPVRHMAGGVVRLGEYTIAANLNQDLFLGDPVVLTGTGRNITIAIAATDNPVLGAFAGVQYVNENGEQKFDGKWPAQSSSQYTNIKALVYDDPFTIFSIQMDGTAGLAEADVGATTNLVAGTGNAFTRRSAWQADQSEIDTDVADQLRILGLDPTLGNAYGQYAKTLVQINRHQYGGQPHAGV